MIYGQDQAVRYPVKDLYDTGMMSMYIGAIKDEYERGLKEQEEFISKYGDFISPFKKDVETWDRLTMDPFVQAYDTMIANGIDPLRSQEGRALFASIRRHIPRETLSQLRQSAAAGQEYLKNRADLQSKGLYDPEFENFLLNGVQFDDYDTTKSGMWSRTSPTEYKGLRTLTDPWFKNRTEKYKYTKNGYDYFGYDTKDMQQTANTQIDAFLASDYGKFFYDRALKIAQQSRQPGESDTQVSQRAKGILVDDIVDANADYLMHNREVNPIYLENLRNAHENARMRMRLAASKAESEKTNNVYNYHESALIRGALSLIPGGKSYYAKNGADASAEAASYHVKQAIINWKEKHAKVNSRGALIMDNDYKKKFLNYTGALKESPTAALARFRKSNDEYVVNRNTNTRSVVLSDTDLQGIEGTDTYVRNTIGYTGKYRSDEAKFRKRLKKGESLTASPTGRIFTKMDADGRLKQYAQCNIYRSKLVYGDKDNPNKVTSVDDKYLQQAYIPIQQTEAVPNGSYDTPMIPAENTWSDILAKENAVQHGIGGGTNKDAYNNIDAQY